MKFFAEIKKKIKWFWIRKYGEPYSFEWLSESDTRGVPVGPELEAHHLTFHDMAWYACCFRLTKEVILSDLDANAIRISRFRRTVGCSGITTFQPCKIESE